MEYRHSKGDLEQMQSLPLKAKITMTERRIFDWYEHWNGDVYLSFSGGKDSTVLKYIVDNMGLNIPSVFINTGLEFPEIQRFAMSQPNVTTVRPKMMFSEVLKKHGYPVASKEVSQKVESYRKGQQWARKYFESDEKVEFGVADRWKILIDAPFDVSSLLNPTPRKIRIRLLSLNI